MTKTDNYSGIGVCNLPSGASYEGEVLNGKWQGYGEMKFQNRDVYKGEWNEGIMHGNGEYFFYDKEKRRYTANYKGDFVIGKREGSGEMQYPNKDKYIGQWQNDQRTGEGICWFSNGDCFFGLWRFDEMIRGTYHLANGDVYDGEIKNGNFNGYGKYYWKETGSWFEGTFAKGKPIDGIKVNLDKTLNEYKDGVML